MNKVFSLTKEKDNDILYLICHLLIILKRRKGRKPMVFAREWLTDSAAGFYPEEDGKRGKN